MRGTLQTDIEPLNESLARDLMGANGITLEYPVFRHMCNLESVFSLHALHWPQKLTGGSKKGRNEPTLTSKVRRWT